MKSWYAVLSTIVGDCFSCNIQIHLAELHLNRQQPYLHVRYGIVVFIQHFAAYDCRRHQPHRHVLDVFTGGNFDYRLVFPPARVREKSLALRHKTITSGFNVLENEMTAGVATLGLAAGTFHAQQRDAGPRDRATVLHIDNAAFNNRGRQFFRRRLRREWEPQRQDYENSSMSTYHSCLLSTSITNHFP